MAAVSITMGKFIAGIVIAILAASAIKEWWQPLVDAIYRGRVSFAELIRTFDWSGMSRVDVFW